MKTNSVNFTGYVVTKGHSCPQTKLQSMFADSLFASNNPSKYAKSIDYTNNMNYFSVLYDGSDPVQYVIHATDEKSVRELSALSKGKTWVRGPQAIETLIQKYNVQSYNVNSVLKGIKDMRFNPFLAEFLTVKTKAKKPQVSKQIVKHQEPLEIAITKIKEIPNVSKLVDAPPVPCVKVTPVAKLITKFVSNFKLFLKTLA